MRHGDKKIFIDKDKLCLMLNLRINGYAITSLAVLFSCDTSSIRAQCDKYNIQPKTDTYTIERIISQTINKVDPQDPSWRWEDGKKINMGKSYEEYLQSTSRW